LLVPLALSLALLPSTPTFGPLVRTHRRAGLIFASEPSPAAEAEATAEEQPDTIFTLEDRQDGWDDVRNSIKTGIKERAGGVEGLNAWSEKYVAPVGRWAKVLADELPVELPSVDLPKPSLPSAEALKTAAKAPAAAFSPPATPAAPAATLKDRALGLTTTLLDAAAKQRQAAAKEAPDAAPVKAKKEVSVQAATVASGNVLLLACIPIGTLGALYLLATGS